MALVGQILPDPVLDATFGQQTLGDRLRERRLTVFHLMRAAT